MAYKNVYPQTTPQKLCIQRMIYAVGGILMILQAEACARGTGTAAADCFVVVDVWVLCFSRCKFGVDEHRTGAGGVGASAAQIIAKCTL